MARLMHSAGGTSHRVEVRSRDGMGCHARQRCSKSPRLESVARRSDTFSGEKTLAVNYEDDGELPLELPRCLVVDRERVEVAIVRGQEGLHGVR